MTIRQALASYLGIVLLAIAGAWVVGYFVEWWAGMMLLTVLVLEHAWRVVKRIRQNTP